MTQKTLETMPARSLALLRGIGMNKGIRRAMNRLGYTPRDQQEGWGLLLLVSDDATGLEEAAQETEDARDAMVEIDAEDEDIFHLVAATLERRFPAQAAFVLKGIGPGEGANAVIGMALVLDRIDALENAPNRAATREQDQAAVATLAARSLDAAKRAQLRALVVRARAAEVVPADEAVLVGAEEKYVANLVRLRAWCQEWSQIARAVPSARLVARVGTSVATRRVLAARGFGNEEYEDGWKRLLACAKPCYGDDDSQTDQAVARAILDVAPRMCAAAKGSKSPSAGRNL